MKQKTKLALGLVFTILFLAGIGFSQNPNFHNWIIHHVFAQSTSCRTPIFLVHGLGGHAERWEEEGTFYENLQEKGYLRGDNVFFFEYAPVGGPEDPYADITESAQKLADEINQQSEKLRNNYCPNDRVAVIAHSMGGLVTRQYLKDHQHDHKISKFIDIGTPHSGSSILGGADITLDSISSGLIPDLPGLDRVAAPLFRESLDWLVHQLWETFNFSAPDPTKTASKQLLPDSDFITQLNHPAFSPEDVEYYMIYGKIEANIQLNLFDMQVTRGVTVGDGVVSSKNASTIPGIGNTSGPINNITYETYSFPATVALKIAIGLSAPYDFELEGDDEAKTVWHSGLVTNDAVNQRILDILGDDLDPRQPETVDTATSATVLVFDTSGSMAEEDVSGLTKLDAAVEAGNSILDVINAETAAGVDSGSSVGVVDFSEGAWIGSELTTDMTAVQASFEDFYAEGGTALPSGLETALSLYTNTPEDASPIIILLSDGMPNIGLNYEEDKSVVRQQALDLASTAGEEGVCIYTIGFGVPGATGSQSGEASIDEGFLIEIAERSGCGKYYNAQNASQLANIYITLRHESVGNLIFQEQGQISQGESKNIGNVQIPANQDMLLFTLKWPGSRLDPVLIDPKGKQVDENYPNANISKTSSLATIIVNSPKAGNWQLGAKGVDVPGGTTNFNALLSTRVRTSTPGQRHVAPSIKFPLVFLLAIICLGGGFIYYYTIKSPKVKAHLRFFDDTSQGRRIQIQDGYVVGRSSTTNIQLRDARSSRQHARFRYAEGAWFIQDLNSTGGTYVNGRRIQATRLTHGDKIRIGRTVFTFHKD